MTKNPKKHPWPSRIEDLPFSIYNFRLLLSACEQALKHIEKGDPREFSSRDRAVIEALRESLKLADPTHYREAFPEPHWYKNRY